jgi:two-component system, chemotaxis family, sensor kinase CheA
MSPAEGGLFKVLQASSQKSEERSVIEAKLFDTLLEPVFILNNEKKVLYCNEPASLLCDISVRKMMRSQPVFDEVFQFAAPVEHLNTLDLVTDPTPYQEISFTTTSDKSGKIQITLQPFTEMNGAKSWIVFFRDVTLEETLQGKYRAELEQKEDVILDLQKAQAELEQYSKNLEKMVDERTAEVRKLNSLMTALLDSLQQGFFVFNAAGLCLEVCSKACETTIQGRPTGKLIWDVLRLPEKQVPGFKKWMGTMFMEMLPFADLSPLGPQKFPHTEGQEIQLEYYPLRAADGKIDGVVVVASDITNLIAAQKEAETERAHAKMILSLIQHRRQVMSFLQESESILNELKREFKKGPAQADPSNLFRCLHTLKGGAASFSIKQMADQAHEAESLLTTWKSEQKPEQWTALCDSSLKVETHFHHFTVENEQILGSKEKLQQRWLEIPAAKLAQFQTRLPIQLHDEFVAEFLMEPIGEFFKQYNEVTLNVAEREMKQVQPLAFHQSQIPVLPEIYSQLFSTFIHAYRNAVDHGIESPGTRQELGKPEAGKIETFFSVEDDQGQSWLQVEIRDDGGGVDPEKIRARMTKQGIDVSKETDQQVIQHIFDSQFSTKEVVTETSGRGVGMDAILFAAKALGGSSWVDSVKGQGTSLKVRVPYRIGSGKQTKAA